MPNFSYFSYYFCHFRNITWTNSHGVKTLALSVAPQRPPGRRRCPPGSFSPFRGAPRDRGSPGSLTRHPLKDLWVTRSSGSPHRFCIHSRAGLSVDTGVNASGTHTCGRRCWAARGARASSLGGPPRPRAAAPSGRPPRGMSGCHVCVFPCARRALQLFLPQSHA